MEDLLISTLHYARERDYAGYDQFDGISSKLLSILPFESKYLNAAFQQGVKRAPINLRPFLLVPRERNFKGIGLFAYANLIAFERTDNYQYRKEAQGLVEWLINNQVSDYKGFCGGPHYPVQGYQSKMPADTPDIVSTNYAVNALLKADDFFDKDYADIATDAADFLLNELNYETVDEGARITKYPEKRSIGYTLNANAVGAQLLVKVSDHTDKSYLRDHARAILDYVVANQHKSGGWMYTDPPSGTHVNMDSYHNGYIIESLLAYDNILGTDRYEKAIQDGLEFYRTVLFESDGTPNWDESNAYPRSIHSVAQGLIIASRIGDDDFADRILDWTLDHLYAGDGQFYHSERRFYTKRITLMRWCQAWMAYALAVTLQHRNPEEHQFINSGTYLNS